MDDPGMDGPVAQLCSPRQAARTSPRWSGAAARAGAVVLLVVLAGTPTVAEPAGCTLSGGAPWREFESEHFIIDVVGTTQDPASLVAAFEDLRAAVLAALVSDPVEIPGRVRVLVVPHRHDMIDYTGSNDILGMFWVSQFGEPAILISADQVTDLPQVVAHELAHHISSYLFPSQPYWFGEGLAQFVEGVAKVDSQGRRWAGSNPAGGWAAGSVKLPRMRDLFNGFTTEWGANPYLASWVLYRFLWNERGRQLALFQQRLMDGAEPLEAWASAFPEWDVVSGKIANLDRDLTRYQRTGLGVRWEIRTASVDHAFTPRRVRLGDLHISLLAPRLAQANPLVHDFLLRAALEEAEREDPEHPVVTAALARLRGEPVLPALRAVTASRPHDGRGWYLLAKETPDPGARESALRTAVTAWPDGALAHAVLAIHLADTGRARAALPFANRAVELAPWSPTATAALATVALALSRCKEAITLQTRAVAAVDAGGPGSLDGDAASLRSALASMRRRCDPTAAAATPSAATP